MVFFYQLCNLKVLSSVMDLAESMFIGKVFIKERGTEVSHPVRALESYSAISYNCWLFGNKLPTANTAAFYSLYKYIQLLPMRYEQIRDLFPMA
jgi:hypothetical protein